MRQEIGVKMRAFVIHQLSRNIVSPTVPVVCGLSLSFLACVYGSLEPPVDKLAKLAAMAEASEAPTANAQDFADTIAMGMRASLEPEIAALPEEDAAVLPTKPAMKTAEAAAIAAPTPAPAPKVAMLEAKPELRAETTVVPQQASLEEEAAPTPPRRPGKIASAVNRAEEALARRLAHRDGEDAAHAAIDNRTIFEKLFGSSGAPSEKQQGSALAYAAPDAGGGVTSIAKTSDSLANIGSDRYTAVYDISARTVYLPDGTKLEAHSGLGDRLDNPAFVHERMRGPTPPALYSLTPREALFHGVAALRLTPISGSVFGRAGLLAHTYMLGPRGDSNGCVSFRDYQAFLRAFQSGQVKRLAVVAHL